MSDIADSPVGVFFVAMTVTACVCSTCALAAIWIERRSMKRSSDFSRDASYVQKFEDEETEDAGFDEAEKIREDAAPEEDAKPKAEGDLNCSTSLLDMIESSLGVSPITPSGRKSGDYSVGDVVIVHMKLPAEEHQAGDGDPEDNKKRLGPGIVDCIEMNALGRCSCCTNALWVAIGEECVRCVPAQLSRATEEERQSAGLAEGNTDSTMKAVRVYRDIVDEHISEVQGVKEEEEKAPADEPSLALEDETPQPEEVPPPPKEEPVMEEKPIPPPPKEHNFRSMDLLRKLGLLEDDADGPSNASIGGDRGPVAESSAKATTVADSGHEEQGTVADSAADAAATVGDSGNGDKATGWTSLDALERSLEHASEDEKLDEVACVLNLGPTLDFEDPPKDDPVLSLSELFEK